MSFVYAGQYTEAVLGRGASGTGTFLQSAMAVNVYQVGTTTPVTLYTDRTKGTTTANPVNTDAGGNLTFYADPGHYDLVFTPAGGTSQRVSVVVPVDPGELSAAYGPGGSAWTAPVFTTTTTGKTVFSVAQSGAIGSAVGNVGFFVGAQVFAAQSDPYIGWGYNLTDQGYLGAGDAYSAKWQIEGNYNDGASNNIETYFSIYDTNSYEKRPIFVQFKRPGGTAGYTAALALSAQLITFNFDPASESAATPVAEMTVNSSRNVFRVYHPTGNEANIALGYTGAGTPATTLLRSGTGYFEMDLNGTSGAGVPCLMAWDLGSGGGALNAGGFQQNAGLTVNNFTGNNTKAALIALAASGQTGDTFVIGESGGTAHIRATAATASKAASFVVGKAALATTATDGFLYIPTCAGAPTGVPTAQTGTSAVVYDTTDSKLYVYAGGWKSVTLA